ncbi:unnamed protein product [Ectocarpus sp. CCAP 1310/34]|nr:unnamed protein product [Ectocarpus sp. CCAP 1310/34]
MEYSCGNHCTAPFLRSSSHPALAATLAYTSPDWLVCPACYDLQLQIQVVTGHQNDLHSELDACFTPKAQYVLSSCPARMTTNGIYPLYAWPTEDDTLATRYSPKGHSSEVGEVIASAWYARRELSCTSSCGSALRAEGEEICFPYPALHSQRPNKEEPDCNCGSPLCRGKMFQR